MRRKLFVVACALGALAACGPMTKSSRNKPGDGAIIYATTVITMDSAMPSATGVAVKDGVILDVGDINDLVESLPGAKVDESFLRKTLLPGLIDPHLHLTLAAVIQATPSATPWPFAGPDGAVDGYPTREAFFARLKELEAGASAGTTLIVYGYHHLVHGELTRKDLDAVTTTRPLIVWHYSGREFYLNSNALADVDLAGDMPRTLEGFGADKKGAPTGRIAAAAADYLFPKLGSLIFSPARVNLGYKNFADILNANGVTTIAELGYGMLGLPFEDDAIRANWVSPEKSGFRLYLVAEHRAFGRAFGDHRIETIKSMVGGETQTPAPVLPQVKFFIDGDFHAETMRVSGDGYLAGRSKGAHGRFETSPESLAETVRPYWEAGLGARLHANGDAAQEAALGALETLRPTDADNRFVIEHAALLAPDDAQRASALGAAISAASHYVHYLGEEYQAALGPERAARLTPLASLSAAGVPVALHSDAPFAPPSPLRAASLHLTRATHDGNALTPQEALSPIDALEAITIDAAFALGLENEIGSIKAGKRADFAVLNQNPLATAVDRWDDIGVWGVVIGGEKRPLASVAPE